MVDLKDRFSAMQKGVLADEIRLLGITVGSVQHCKVKRKTQSQQNPTERPKGNDKKSEVENVVSHRIVDYDDMYKSVQHEIDRLNQRFEHFLLEV